MSMTPGRLREVLGHLQLTQVAFAREVGVKERQVHRWVSGDSPIPDDYVPLRLNVLLAGDWLRYLVQMARDDLNSSYDGALYRAAAATSAAFTTAIRQIGRVVAQTRYDDGVREVIDAINGAGVLKTAEVQAAKECLTICREAVNGRTNEMEIDRADLHKVLDFIGHLQRFR